MEIDVYKRQDEEHENHWFFEGKKNIMMIGEAEFTLSYMIPK